jgi:hypothetical protein
MGRLTMGSAIVLVIMIVVTTMIGRRVALARARLMATCELSDEDWVDGRRRASVALGRWEAALHVAVMICIGNAGVLISASVH